MSGFNDIFGALFGSSVADYADDWVNWDNLKVFSDLGAFSSQSSFGPYGVSSRHWEPGLSWSMANQSLGDLVTLMLGGGGGGGGDEEEGSKAGNVFKGAASGAATGGVMGAIGGAIGGLLG